MNVLSTNDLVRLLFAQFEFNYKVGDRARWGPTGRGALVACALHELHLIKLLNNVLRRARR